MRTVLSVLLVLAASAVFAAPAKWEPIGISGNGGMYSPAISPVNPKLMMAHCDMSGAYLSRDGGDTWEMINCLQLRASTSCKPAFHPTDAKVIFSAQYGAGMKVSRDGGKIWSDVPGVPKALTGEIRIDPARPGRMMCGDKDGAVLSDDGGKTWTRCAGVQGAAVAFHFDQTSAADARVCFAATAQGVYRSDDGGKTWALKVNGLPNTTVKAFAGGSNAKTRMLYVSVTASAEGGRHAGGVFRSSDRGETWESAMGQGINKDTAAADQWSMGPVAQYIDLLTTDARPDAVWAMNTNTGVRVPHHTACFRSDDAGRTWRATFYPDPRFKECNTEPDIFTVSDGQFYQGPMRTAVDPKNPDHVLVLMGKAYVTEDGGKAWKCAHVHKAGEADGEALWKCNGLVVTTTWNYYFDPFDHKRQYIAYTDIGYARSTDGGKLWRWSKQSEQPEWRNTCYEMAFEPTQKGKIWGAFSSTHDIPNSNIVGNYASDKYPGAVCLSTDYGRSWKPSNAGLPAVPCVSVVMDPKSPPGRRTLWTSMFNDGVYKSADDGKTWKKSSDGLGDPSNMRVCRLALHEDGTLFVVITGRRDKQTRRMLAPGAGLWRSKDAGASWECISKSRPFLWAKDFTVDPKDSNVILLGASDTGAEDQGGLWRTTDGGASWTRIGREGRQTFGGYLHPKRPGWIYMTLTEGAPAAGLWLSKDNGATWKPMAGLPFANAQRVIVDPDDPDVIYVTTFGGSVWRGPAEE